MSLSVNLKNIQTNVRNFVVKKYNQCSDYLTLALVNTLNRNLRNRIVKRGLSPDHAPELPFHELIKGAVEQGLRIKRAPVPFHFLGGDYVSDPKLHPILQSRLKYAKHQEELAVTAPVEEDDLLKLLVTEEELNKAVQEVISKVENEPVPMPRKVKKAAKNRRRAKAKGK